MSNVGETLQQHQFGCILKYDYRQNPVYVFDLTNNNQALSHINRSKVEEFDSYISGILMRHSIEVGIGKYNEDRNIYTSDLFNDENIRTIHLGIDLWTQAGTEVFCPYEGTIHSFANNDHRGDYGPTIILQHEIDGHVFYTLYGHLSRESLNHLEVGMYVGMGDTIGYIGNYPINGNWPPHLHFQIIEDIGEKNGDYPGVCSMQQVEYYLNNCPNPNYILQIPGI